MKVRLEESTLALCHAVRHDNVPRPLASRLGLPGNLGNNLDDWYLSAKGNWLPGG